MDVSLFAASVSLAEYLPRHISYTSPSQDFRELYPVKIALCLSLCLFSLSVLEATPSTWLLILTKETATTENASNQEHAHHFLSITNAYRFLLWNLSLFVLIVFPCLVGTQIVGRILFRIRSASATVDPDEQKKRTFDAQRKNAWWVNLGYKLLLLIFRGIRLVVIYPCTSLLRRVYGSFCIRGDEPVLVMTQKDVRQQCTNNRIALFIGSSLYRQSLIFGSFLGITATLATLRMIAPLVFHKTTTDASILAEPVSYMCAVGILLSALLNGFGSVSMPHSCLAGLYLEPVHPDAIAKAEIELQQAKTSLENSIAQMDTAGEIHIPSGGQAGTWMRSAPKPSKSFTDVQSGLRTFSRSVPKPSPSFSELGDSLTKRKQSLQSEVDFLGTLVSEMTQDVAEMRYSQAMATNARTTVGRIRSCVGVVFSVVLLIRLSSVAISIWTPGLRDNSSSIEIRPAQGDPVTTALLWLMGKNLVTPQYYNALSQFISLLLTAFLSFSQVRTFLKMVTAFNRRIDHLFQTCYCKSEKKEDTLPGEKLLFNTKLHTHVLASLLGCYFLACIVLTTKILPVEYRAEFSAALGGKEVFQIRTYAVNAAFALSAVVSTVILGMLLGIQRQNTNRYTTRADEDTLLKILNP
jgi:hypothetical protein